MSRPGRRKAAASVVPPPPPFVEPVAAAGATILPASPAKTPRFALPLILAVSASVIALSAYQYGKQSAATTTPQASRLPPLATPPSITPTSSISPLIPVSHLPVLLSSASTITPATASSHPVLRQVAAYGLPALPYTAREGRYAYPLLVREGYVCQWNARTRSADWVMEVLHGNQPPTTPPPLTRTTSAPAAPITADTNISLTPPPTPSPPAPHATRDLSNFRTDPLLSPTSSPPTPGLYLNSSYDRGHLVPAASASSATQSAMDETFYLTNISPQHPNCNRGYWRAIEGWLRETARRWQSTHGPSAALTVLTGPLWLEEPSSKAEAGSDDGGSSSKQRRRYVRYEVIPRSAPLVAVPTHFFKVVLATSDTTAPLLAAFVVPNAPIASTVPLQSFVSSVAAIESNTGWHFFPLLPRSSTTAPTAATAAASAGRLAAGSSGSERAANVIDVVELLLNGGSGGSEGGAGGGGSGSGGRGLSELERVSVLSLCRDGGCDLGQQWRKIEQWAVSQDKSKRGRRSSLSHASKASTSSNDSGVSTVSHNANGASETRL